MMIFNNRIFSSAVDTEDSVEKSFVINLKDAQVEVLQLKIGDSNLERWRAEFIYKDVIYYIEMNGVKETEVKKIIENLYFP